MYKIVKREEYSPVTYMWEVEAPDVAKAAQPGHFVMVKHGEQGERIPLTVADFDRDKGTITLVIQAIGKSTQMYPVSYTHLTLPTSAVACGGGGGGGGV